jgi:hypothetical protein
MNGACEGTLLVFGYHLAAAINGKLKKINILIFRIRLVLRIYLFFFIWDEKISNVPYVNLLRYFYYVPRTVNIILLIIYRIYRIKKGCPPGSVVKAL